MSEVKLFKKINKYVDKDGKEKSAVNFYVQVGNVKIPIEVKYFKDKETGEDSRYRERKAVMAAFAEELSEKTED